MCVFTLKYCLNQIDYQLKELYVYVYKIKQQYKCKTRNMGLQLVLWCLKLFSTICQLYHSSQFYWRKPEYSEKRKPQICRKSQTNYNVISIRHLNMSGIQTHSISGDLVDSDFNEHWWAKDMFHQPILGYYNAIHGQES